MTAYELIALIAFSTDEAFTNAQILDALEDGEAIKTLGITDDDQEVIEEAHAILRNRIATDERIERHFERIRIE